MKQLAGRIQGILPASCNKVSLIKLINHLISQEFVRTN